MSSQKPKSQQTKTPQDTYARTGRTLASEVKRLRGWSDGDPAKDAELADALLALTRHRLLGHAFAEAGADAQEALLTAAKIVASHGPVGPYTPPSEAARYVTATTYLASVQVGLGLAAQGAATVRAILEWCSELPKGGANLDLEYLTKVWGHLALGRGALAEAEVALANAHADAAQAWYRLGPASDDPWFRLVGVDADLLVADARWAAGRPGEAIAAGERAAHAYDALAADAWTRPGALPPALLDRLLEPAPGVFTPLADRALARGDAEVGVAARTRLVDLLRGLPARLAEATRPALAGALASQAVDLDSLGRTSEASALAAEVSDLVGADVAAGLREERLTRLTPAGDHVTGWSAATDFGSPSAPAPTPAPAPAPAPVPAPDPVPAPEPVLAPVVDAGAAEVASARAALDVATAGGGRREIRDAAERLVEVLRPRVAEDRARWTPDLIAALEGLSEARWRAGDLWGSRAPAKEAKELAS